MLSTMSDLRIVPLGVEHRDDVLRIDQAAFAFPMNEVDPVLDTEHFEWDRTYGVLRPVAGARRDVASASWSSDEELAGLMTSFTLHIAVPGAGESVRTTTVALPLVEANEALARVREGRIEGAAVLVP